MYIPKYFALEDRAEIARVLRRHDFALLVTAPGGRISATPLPFLYDQEAGPQGTLLAHMARANPQWKDFALLAESGGEALVVFQGPHGYISPSWYGALPDGVPGAVPTWNYVAVQARGLPRIVKEPEELRALLERLVATQEEGRAQPWSMASQDEGYLARMARGIVGFEIPVTVLEAKAKLSQDKSASMRGGAVAALTEAGDEPSGELARLMAEAAPAS